MIEFKNVSKIYQDKPVVKQLNLKIEKGEFFVLVGHSGSGKTPPLKMINRLIEPEEGVIYKDGRDIQFYELRPLRLEIGYVLQQIALFPNMTVAENISLIPEMKKWPKTKRLTECKILLEKVDLDPDTYLNRLPKDLSGGEQQRVGILRSIISHPDILLMDEPFSALDPISRSQLQELIKQLHQELKMTIVFVTHDMNEACLLADRIGVMKDGEMIQVGSVDQVRDHPANQWVEELFHGGGEGA